MSQGRADDQSTPGGNLTQAGRNLEQMIVQGRSFSGNERNCAFLNTGNSSAAEGRFANISAISGLDYPDDGRAVALVDWDQDGDQDMWISNRNAPRLRLMRNDTPQTNHFVALRLQGNGKKTNRDAIGARVEVVLTKPEQANGNSSNRKQPRSIKTLRAGEGFLAQSSKWLHFGLGEAESINKVIVHWPGAEVEVFTGISINRHYRLVQGTGTPEETTATDRKTILTPSPQKTTTSSQTARVPLIELMAVPKTPYKGFDGKELTLESKPGRLLLVNLWASWCAPCQTELDEFSKHYDKIQAKGIDILALSVDDLGETSTRENAVKLVSSKAFPFSVGEATNTLINDFQILHNLHVPVHEKLPLPSSFLIDQEGRLAVIYKGSISVDTLLADAQHSMGDRTARLVRSAPIGGIAINHPVVEQAAVKTAVALRLKYGLILQDLGHSTQAAKLYTEALQLDAESPEAHHYLGLIRHNQGREADAINHLGEAVRIKPNYSEAHNSFGIALLGKGDTDQAITHFRRAVQLQPGYAAAHNSLGVTFYRQKNYDEAIENYHLALQTQPGWAAVRKNLGLSLQGLATKLNGQPFVVQNGQPDHATMHAALGNVFRDRSDFKDAAKHYQWALNLNPNLPAALNNLAWIRATHPDSAMRNGAEAVRLAERCCKLTQFKLGPTLDTLAAAYAEVGRFDDAIRWQKKAIELAGDTDTSELEKQLKSYQAGKPLRR